MQAHRLQQQTGALHVDVVVSSPLTRALQTASIAFAPQLADGSIPAISLEGCRERFGKQNPDARRRTSEVAAQFPRFDMRRLARADALHGEVRETLAELSIRAAAFVPELLALPHRHVAVVSHSGFLAALFNVAADCSDAPELAGWFDTAEMRAVHLEPMIRNVTEANN